MGSCGLLFPVAALLRIPLLGKKTHVFIAAIIAMLAGMALCLLVIIIEHLKIAYTPQVVLIGVYVVLNVTHFLFDDWSRNGC